MVQCVSAMRVPLSLPDNAAQWHRGIVTACHVTTAPAYKDSYLSHSSSYSHSCITRPHNTRARIGRTVYWRSLLVAACTASYSVLAIQIVSVYSSSSAAQIRTIAAGVSLRVVARCGARRPAMATMLVRGRKAEYHTSHPLSTSFLVQ